MFKRFKVTGINENPKKPKRNLMKYLVLGCVMALPAFALLKTGVLSMNKNVLAADKNKYDIVADLDGGKFEMGTTPEFTKMDNGNWLYKYKPVPTPTKLPVPVKDGYDFTGWTVSAKPDIQKEYSIPAWHKGNLNVKANWKVKGATLMSGPTFNSTIKQIPGFANVTEIRFVKGTPNPNGVNVAVEGEAKAYIEGNVLTVASEGEIFANKDCSKMFYQFGYTYGVNSLDLSNFDTSQVTDMQEMFRYCTKLISLDVSNFDTSQVTDMYGMFNSCYKLTSLDVSNFNTSQVTDMQSMFDNCSSLTSLDLSNFNTSQVTDMYGMFKYCEKLTSLNVSNFDTSQVTDMRVMFRGCNKLNCSITIMNPNTSYSNMFTDCSTVSPAKFVVNYTSGCKTVAQNMVNTKSSNSNVVLGGMPSTLTNGYSFNVTLTMMEGFENVTEIHFEQKNGTLSGTDVSEAKDGSIKARISGNILYVEANGEIFANEDCGQMFHNLGSGGTGRILNKIIFNNFNTSKVTDMSWMFNNCEKLTSLDVSNFNTSKVTDMSNMLQSCESLTNIKGLENFDTSQVTNMQQMFMTCNKLTSLDVSNFDTSKVTNMQYMFDDCSSLSSLNVSRFNTSNVTNMSYMFRFCEKLTSLDVSNFNTSKVTDMSRMFSGCKSLASLDVSNFDTSQVTNMSSMFYSCSSLSSLDVSNFNTSQVEYIKDMFNSCNNLSGEITIMNPNITNYYDSMFYNCSTDSNTKFIVKYVDEATKAVAEKLVATKSANSNVYLDGTQPATLMAGTQFRTTLKEMSGFENVTEIRFVKGTPNTNGVNVAIEGEAKAHIEGSILTIASKGEIFANKDCSWMFSDLKKLNKIIFDNFDTSNVIDMTRMFDACNSLTSLDLSNFNTSKVTSMSSMFGGCNSLTSLDLSNFDTSRVDMMSYMFENDNLLTNIKGLENFDTSRVYYIAGLFNGCSKLSGQITIMNADIPSVYIMFKNCSTDSNSKFIVKYTNDTTKALAKNMVATKSTNSNVYLDGTQPATLMDGDTFHSTLKRMSGFNNVTEIRFVKGTPHPNGTNVAIDGIAKAYISGSVLTVASEQEIFANKDCSSMFEEFGCSYGENKVLNKITFNNFNTSNVTNMRWMFEGCHSLTSLNVTNFDTSNVTNMYSMFDECKLLRSINVSNFDTSKVRYMDYMFSGCESLTSLDLSRFNTSNVITMEAMFGSFTRLGGCTALTSIRGLENFDTSNVVSMARIFGGCESLTRLNLSKWNTEKVADMELMFSGCEKLTSLDMSSFNTSQVTDMSDMFEYCKSLTSLDISSFDTSQVTDISWMFHDCINLTSVRGLEKLDTGSVSEMNSMFQNCPKLSGQITISNPNMSNYKGIFYKCSTVYGSKFIVNYKPDCKDIAQNMVATESSNSNVVLGTQKSLLNEDIPNKEEPSVPNTVTLTIKNGNTTATKEILAGEIGSLNTPSKEGMVFSGYFYDAEYTKPVSERDVISEDTTIYIKWDKNSVFKSVFNPNKVYNSLAKPAPTSYAAAHQNAKPVAITRQINITLNNGSMAMYPVQKIQVNSGKIGDLPKPDLNPKYAGRFGGYFYDKNCTIPVKPNDTVTQDIELYAKW